MITHLVGYTARILEKLPDRAFDTFTTVLYNHVLPMFSATEELYVPR